MSTTRKTWPKALLRKASAWAEEYRHTTEYVSDLELPEEEDAFRAMCDGNQLLAYHATKLLPHEVLSVRLEGLHAASQKLVTYRLRRALEAGSIDQSLHDSLADGNLYAENDFRGRDAQVCLVLSRRPFDREPRGFRSLLAEWGGELITMARGGSQFREQLRKIGVPSVVVVSVDMSVSHRVHASYPPLHKLFVGRLLELDDLGADVHYRQPVEAGQVLDVWQPGHPEYDRHPALPKV